METQSLGELFEQNPELKEAFDTLDWDKRKMFEDLFRRQDYEVEDERIDQLRALLPLLEALAGRTRAKLHDLGDQTEV